MKVPLQFLIIATNLALCAIMLVRGIFKPYPCLCRYAFFQVCASVVSLVAYEVTGDAAYAVIYYLLIFAGNILAAFVSAEIAGKLLGPNGALPGWVTIKLMSWIGLGIAAALAVAVLLMCSNYGSSWARAMVTVEQWMAGTLWVAFSVILIFWRTLKVFRRQTRAASICLGFVLYFTVSIFAVFVRGHKVPAELAEAAKHAGMIAYLIMLLWWTGVLLMPAPVFEKATAEQKEQVLDEFEETQQAAGRVAIASR